MGFGFEKPEYAFGVTEPLSLDRVAPDAAFLEWGERSNAAAIVASCLESDLLGSDEAAAGVSQSEQQLDQLALMFGLLRFCRERWAGQDVGLLALADSYLRIGRDPAVRKTWLEAAAISTQGAQLHYQQPQQAFEAYNLALRKFEEAGDLKGIGRNIGNIALLNLEAGSLTDAIKLAGRALLIHQRVDYHRGQMMHLLNLAKAHAQLKHWDKALQARRVRQSIEHWIDPTEAAFSEAHVALCLRESGDESAARESFDKALLLAGRLQFPDQFANLAQALAPLADAWNQRQRVESVLSRAQAECVTTLGQLDAQPLFGSGPILLKFREALPTMDRQALHEAVAANRRWAVALVESLLVQNLFHSLNGDQATAASADQLAGALALQLCRSWHLRWPFDEVTLFRSWPTGKKVAKAKAYDAKARGLYLAWQGERVQGRELLTAAAALHEMIGDPYAVAPWFSEVFRELDMLGEDRAAMYGAVYHSDALAARGDEERALDGLMRALEIAREKGSRLNVADKYIRLAIFHHRRNQMDAAAHWFQSAEIAFRELDAVGLSASDELGRINNGIKLAVHLGEYLRDAGRYSELAFVLVPALHETDWFIETFGDTAGEYLQRAKDYKGRMLYCLAKGYSRLGGFEKSLDYARRMAAWYELLQDPEGRPRRIRRSPSL